jgi:quinol monooxygenase YgiN
LGVWSCVSACAATAAHGQGEHTKKMAAAIRDLLDGPVDAQRLVLISSR